MKDEHFKQYCNYITCGIEPKDIIDGIHFFEFNGNFVALKGYPENRVATFAQDSLKTSYAEFKQEAASKINKVETNGTMLP